MKKSVNQFLVIFGASGDLTRRKLIPALYDLFKQKLLPEKIIVLGASRKKLSDEEFRNVSSDFLPDEKQTDAFKELLFYEQVFPGQSESFIKLKERIEDLGKKFNIDANCIFYLSTPPSVYGKIAKNISSAGLSGSDKFFRRLIVEKPFGTDFESSKELNLELLNYFDENQIYRIDHYLGKESVQNMLVTRFGNGIFEPLWNRNYIHHVEITSSESIGVENRGGYYDHSGALKDMVQNHLMQLVGLVAMEGGIFHIVNDTIIMSLLFLTAGVIIYKTGTKDMNKMSGLAHEMPFTMVLFLIGVLALAGLPPFNGFASKLLIYESTFHFNPLLTIIAILVSILTLASFVKIFYSAFMGPRLKEYNEKRDVPKTMRIAMLVLALLILLLGLFPNIVVDNLISPAAHALIDQLKYVGGVL